MSKNEQERLMQDQPDQNEEGDVMFDATGDAIKVSKCTCEISEVEINTPPTSYCIR
jgi:hypothetical protein